MIPVLLVIGFVVGRWPVLLPAIVLWPAIVFVQGGIRAADLLGIALFAGLNAAVGVGLRRGFAGILAAVRRVGRPHRAA